MTELGSGPSVPDEAASNNKETALNSAAGLLAGEALTGSDPSFSDEHKGLTAEDWVEVRKRAGDIVRGSKQSSPSQERESAKEPVADKEKTKSNLIDRAATGLAGEALSGIDPGFGEEYNILTQEDWNEARRRASDKIRKS